MTNANVQKISQTITPFGGIHFINAEFSRCGLSQMNANTVFLILTAMLKNFYLYIVKNVANVFTNILPTTRIKRFIFRFICVAGKWTKQGRQNILKRYTDRPYERLRFSHLQEHYPKFFDLIIQPLHP